MSGKAIKIAGFIVTILGAATSVASSWIDDKKLNEKIDEKFNEHLASQDNGMTKEP